MRNAKFSFGALVELLVSGVYQLRRINTVSPFSFYYYVYISEPLLLCIFLSTEEMMLSLYE